MKHHESSIEIGAISNKSKLIPLVLGPSLALLLYFLLPEQYTSSAGTLEVFSHSGRACAGIVLWMAIWWFTEAVPIAVTSLLPIVLFPMFGVMGSSDTLKEYANGTIFLFLGGFLIAAGIARWHLDRRIALLTIRLVGTKPQQIILGLLLATSFISAWVSNTATAAMMVPIALAVLKVVRSTREDVPIDQAEHNFGICVLLAVAYGASLGGVLTLIGTPPNGIFARFVEQTYGTPVNFLDWMLIAFPIVLVMVVVTHLLMTKVLFRELVSELPGGKEWVMHEYSKLGPMSRGEKIVLTVFVSAALLWCFGPMIRSIQIGDLMPFKPLSDTVIAMTAGIILFVIPVDQARDSRIGLVKRERNCRLGRVAVVWRRSFDGGCYSKNGIGRYYRRAGDIFVRAARSCGNRWPYDTDGFCFGIYFQYRSGGDHDATGFCCCGLNRDAPRGFVGCDDIRRFAGIHDARWYAAKRHYFRNRTHSNWRND